MVDNGDVAISKQKGIQISFESIIEKSNKMIEGMSQSHRYYFAAEQPTLTVGTNGINRVLAVSKDNIEDTARLKLRAKRFYERLGKSPILPRDGRKDGKLILKKGQSIHFVNLGIMSFCDKNRTVVPIAKSLSSIAREGIVTNADSYVLDEYNPKLINNCVSVLEMKKSIGYREWAEQNNPIMNSFPELHIPNPHFNLSKIGATLTRYDVQATGLGTLDYVVGNDAMSYEEIAPLLYELGTFGLVLETRGKEFEEYVATDKVKEMSEDEYMQHKMYTFGIPSMFISGVIMSDCAALNDDVSKLVYNNFKDRYIYNSRGEVLNNPVVYSDLSEAERYEVWNKMRNSAALSEEYAEIEKC